MNHEAFRHTARNDPLNDSMMALSAGLPGREKSRITPFSRERRSGYALTSFPAPGVPNQLPAPSDCLTPTTVVADSCSAPWPGFSLPLTRVAPHVARIGRTALTRQLSLRAEPGQDLSKRGSPWRSALLMLLMLVRGAAVRARPFGF